MNSNSTLVSTATPLEVPEQVAFLMDAVNDLELRVERLNAIFPNDSSGKNQSAPEKIALCPLANTLRDVHERIRAINFKLASAQV